MRPIAKALLLPNLLVLLSCAMPDPVIPTQPLTGDWGGAHVGLTLGAGAAASNTTARTARSMSRSCPGPMARSRCLGRT